MAAQALDDVIAPQSQATTIAKISGRWFKVKGLMLQGLGFSAVAVELFT